MDYTNSLKTTPIGPLSPVPSLDKFTSFLQECCDYYSGNSKNQSQNSGMKSEKEEEQKERENQKLPVNFGLEINHLNLKNDFLWLMDLDLSNSGISSLVSQDCSPCEKLETTSNLTSKNLPYVSPFMMRRNFTFLNANEVKNDTNNSCVYTCNGRNRHSCLGMPRNAEIMAAKYKASKSGSVPKIGSSIERKLLSISAKAKTLSSKRSVVERNNYTYFLETYCFDSFI